MCRRVRAAIYRGRVLAAVTLQSVAVFVHVAAAVAAFGATLGYVPMATWVRRHHPRALPALHAGTAWASGVLVTRSMVVVLVVGLALAVAGGDVLTGWVLGSLAALVAVFGIYGAVVTPRSREAAEVARAALAADDTGGAEARLGPAYEVLFRRLVGAHLVASGLVLLALFLMVTRPF